MSRNRSSGVPGAGRLGVGGQRGSRLHATSWSVLFCCARVQLAYDAIEGGGGSSDVAAHFAVKMHDRARPYDRLGIRFSRRDRCDAPSRVYSTVVGAVAGGVSYNVTLLVRLALPCTK